MNGKLPDHFYRFRSAKALLGPYDEAKGQFEELERQEIYFSRPEELNDAMEGFKDLFWQGDEIVWRNLLRHYLYCLMMTSYMVASSAATFMKSNCDSIVHQTPDDMPEAPVRGVYKEICDDFFAHQITNDLISALAARATPIRRDELAYYLRAVSPLALPLILQATMTHGAGEEIQLLHDAESGALGALSLDSLGALLKHPDYRGMPDATAMGTELVFMQSGLRQDSGSAWTAEQAAVIFLTRDFPAYYVELLEKLIYPDWHAACFVPDPANPSMWGGYADGHRGVCLKFSASANSAGTASLSLYRAHSWSGNKAGVTTNYAYVPHPFEEVIYTHDYPEIDFFASLGTVPMPKLTHFWLAGPDGTLSAIADKIFKHEEEWRRQHWDTFRIGATSKTSEWSHEREYRLILSSNLQRFDDKPSRKLKYRFSDLSGIGFGMKTTAEDKIRIIKIVEQKCRSEGRADFEFYQARYSRKAQKIELVPLTLLKVNSQ